MPLMTEIRKGNGHRLEVRWGWWHVMMMLAAAGKKSVFEWDFPTGEYVMPHDFSVCDVSDHEEFTLKKGWTLSMWRS